MILKSLKKIVTHKVIVAVISFILQAALIAFMVFNLSMRIWQLYVFMEVVSIILVLYLSTRNEINPRFVLSWVIVVLALPIVGTVFYFLFGNRKVPKELLRKSKLNEAHVGISLQQDSEILKEFVSKYPQYLRNMTYLEENLHYPVYANTKTEYYPLGELGFQAILEDISKAKRSVFIEYFIIKAGKMWNQLLTVLEEKARQGVDIRLIFDDWGCPSFDQELIDALRNKNIKAVPFNPLTYKFVVQMNNRSHRKMVIVDGNIGFISGINLADEYINEKQRFGHWKDNVVRIEGQAVLSLVEMFLAFWSYCNEGPMESIDRYKEALISCEDDGYVQPYADNPTDDFAVTETLHINAISNARHSVFICTPYLVIGFEMIRALSSAALSGVDVRIVLPGIPDKKTVYMITRSNYDKLLAAGVKVYEYSPGFIHQKTMVVDGELALISTANMDYRSYYLNFECGIAFYNSKAVTQTLEDFENILAVSHQVTLQEVQQLPFYTRISRAIINLFSGLF